MWSSFIVILCWDMISTAYSLEHSLKLHNINCIGKPPVNLTCSWTEVNSTVGILNVDAFTPTTLHTAKIHIQLFYKYQLGGFRPFMINTVQDLCAFSKKGNNILELGEIITRNIKDYFYNLKCPLEGHTGLKDVPVNMEKIVGFFPAGDYRVNATIIGNSKPVAWITTQTTVTVLRKNKG